MICDEIICLACRTRSVAHFSLLSFRNGFRRGREGGHWDWIRPLSDTGIRYAADDPSAVVFPLVSWGRWPLATVTC
jgi:hypothetical protein